MDVLCGWRSSNLRLFLSFENIFVVLCWAEALLKIARMTLTIKRDGNWSSFQLANSALPLSVTSSAIAPSARMPKCDSPGHNFQKFLKTGCSKIKLDFKSHVFFCSLTCVPLLCHMCSAVLSHVFRCSFTCVPLFCHMCSAVFRCSVPLFCQMCSAVLSHVFRCSVSCVTLFCHMCSVRCSVTCVPSAVLSHVFRPLSCHMCSVRYSVTGVPSAALSHVFRPLSHVFHFSVTCIPLFCHLCSATDFEHHGIIMFFQKLAPPHLSTKLTWLVLGEDQAARSHRVEHLTAL